MRFGLPAFLTVLLLAAPAAKAEHFPGQTDPAFVAAVDQWLNTDDPVSAAAEIGQIAADGNVAAQFLGNILWRNPGWYDPEISMTREERLALFPPAGDGSGTARFQPYNMDMMPTPDFAALRSIQGDTEPDELFRAAQTMLDGGMRTGALHMVTSAWADERNLDDAVLAFAAEHITLADSAIGDFWTSLMIERVAAETFPVDQPDLERAAAFERFLAETGYFSAVQNGHWLAIRVAAFEAFLRQGGTSPPDLDLDPNVAAVMRITLDTAENVEVVDENWQIAGRLVFNSSSQIPDLRPLVTICNAYCSGHEAQCAGWGAMNGFERSLAVTRFEPVIDAASYLSSARAVDERLGSIRHFGALPNAFPDAPQCLIDAAR